MLQVGGGGGAQQSSSGTGYRLARPGEMEDRVSRNKAEPYALCGPPKEVRERGAKVLRLAVLAVANSN